MNYKDQWATTEDGKQFVFTVEMQRQLSEAGLPVVPESLGKLDPAQTRSTPSSAPAPQKKAESESPRQESEPEPEFEEPDTIQIDPQTGKYLGRVKWFNPTKGYGFIARGGGEEIFFHKSELLCNADDLYTGTWILYDVEETAKGLEANEIDLYTES